MPSEPKAPTWSLWRSKPVTFPSRPGRPERGVVTRRPVRRVRWSGCEQVVRTRAVAAAPGGRSCCSRGCRRCPIRVTGDRAAATGCASRAPPGAPTLHARLGRHRRGRRAVRRDLLSFRRPAVRNFARGERPVVALVRCRSPAAARGAHEAGELCSLWGIRTAVSTRHAGVISSWCRICRGRRILRDLADLRAPSLSASPRLAYAAELLGPSAPARSWCPGSARPSRARRPSRGTRWHRGTASPDRDSTFLVRP